MKANQEPYLGGLCNQFPPLSTVNQRAVIRVPELENRNSKFGYAGGLTFTICLLPSDLSFPCLLYDLYGGICYWLLISNPASP